MAEKVNEGINYDQNIKSIHRKSYSNSANSATFKIKICKLFQAKFGSACPARRQMKNLSMVTKNQLRNQLHNLNAQSRTTMRPYQSKR